MERIIRLAIVDSDEQYANRLADGIAAYPEFELSIFGDVDSLEEALHSRHYDIVLFSQDIGFEPHKKGRVLQMCLLENPGEISDKYKDHTGILKYQRVSKIYRELLERYADMRGEIRSDERSFVLGVYSPVGGSGKSAMSLVIAERLALQGYRVLYQNMEELSSGSAYFSEDPNEHGISQLLEYLERDIDFSTKIKSLMHKKGENLYYMNSFRTPNDLRALTGEDMEKLFEKLQRAGLFDCIVVDMSSSFFGMNLKLFDISDVIVVVGRSGKAASEKMRRFYEQSHIINQYSDRMVQIDNFYTEGAAVRPPIPVIGRIKAYQNYELNNLVYHLSTSASVSFLDQLLY